MPDRTAAAPPEPARLPQPPSSTLHPTAAAHRRTAAPPAPPSRVATPFRPIRAPVHTPGLSTAASSTSATARESHTAAHPPSTSAATAALRCGKFDRRTPAVDRL